MSFPNSCDSTVVLNLELRPSFDTTLYVTYCDNYHWKSDEYQVDITFDHSTVYPHQYTNVYGCESMVTLDLTINTFETHNQLPYEQPIEYNGVIGCDSARWAPNGFEYSTNDVYAPGEAEDWWYKVSAPANNPYKRVYHNQLGCDSIVTFPLSLEYTPAPGAIYPVDANNTSPHWVITATEFQINAYEFSIYEEQHPGLCHWDSVVWKFEDSNVQWLIERDETTNPPGKNCKVYVLNYIADTIWLDAIAYNKCNVNQGGSVRRYWFVCSFYGIEEQPEIAADFTVVPNPNNGTMTLNFEKLTGKIDLKVYDMRGNLIDRLSTYSIGGPETMQYNMKHRSDGIYFFVATGKEGTVAKKVVIQK